MRHRPVSGNPLIQNGITDRQPRAKTQSRQAKTVILIISSPGAFAPLREKLYTNGAEFTKNTTADLSPVYFAEYSGIGRRHSDFDYYSALGRFARMAFLEYHRFLDYQRHRAVSSCLAGL